MKLATVRLPKNATTPFDRDLLVALTRHLEDIVRQINAMSDGVFVSIGRVATEAPTEPGSPGDFVKNAARTVVGMPGARYIVDGWEYTATDGWEQRIFFTGN